MQYQDFSQIKEILIIRIQQFFINPKIALVALVLSVALLIWQLYLIIGLYLFTKSDSANQFLRFENTGPQELESKLPDEFKLLPKLTNMEQYHLFGVIAKSGGTMAQALKSSLPLILKGVMAYTNSKYGHAIIKDDSGKEKYYNTGDKISSNLGTVTLEYVFKDRVFIRNNGVLEYILYPKLDLSTKPTASYSFPKDPLISNNSMNNQVGESSELNKNRDGDHGFSAKQNARKALRALKNNAGLRKARKLNSQSVEQTERLDLDTPVNSNANPNSGSTPELELKESKESRINTLGRLDKIIISKQHWKSVAK